MIDCRLRVAGALAMCLVLAGCVTIAPPSPSPTSAVGDLPPDAELFPEPPILEHGEVPAYEETTPITGHLTLGTPTDAMTASVGQPGGRIETSGLRIDFAPGTLAADTAFSIISTPITAADFGGTVTPLTPLYTVDGGDVALGVPATVTLAANIPDGATAMAFWYDDAAGRLTPLTPITQDATSLTVGATHFSAILGARVDLAGVSATVDSGFRPGIDDWQFTNYGSYVAPGGHCEGQSLSAIWYYVTQRRGAGASSLYGLYDNNGAPDKTTTFQWDDADGYRFASVVQVDPVANAVANQQAYAREASPNDALTYAAFRAAFALSGEPQLIWLATADRSSGHAMIVYRVTSERLFVADPNYPARLRTIRYDAGSAKFATFGSGNNAADIAVNGVKDYTRFTFVPWRALRSEAALAARWAELEDNKVGDSVFPAYTIKVRPADSTDEGDWTPLTAGYQTDAASISIRHVGLGTGWLAYRGIFRLPAGDVALDEGPNDLGIHTLAQVSGEWKYVDFQRFNVIRGPAPTPSMTAGSSEPVPSGTGQVGTGEWVLQQVIMLPEPTEDSDCYFGHEVALGDGGFTSSGSWKDEGCRAEGGPYYSGTISSTCSWTAPPSYLKVGETLALTMECQSTANQTGGGRHGGGQGWMYMTLNPLPDNLGGRFGWSQKILGDVQSGAWSGDLPRSDSKSGSIEIPGGSQDDILVIYASLGGPGGGGQLIYKYVYGGTDPLPPRVTAPPITPATPLPTPLTTLPAPTQEPTTAAPSIPTATVPPAAEADEMYRILSIGVAYNGATAPTTFTITTPWLVTEIIDYHWNNGHGVSPVGTIALRGPNGAIYGPWQAAGRPGQGGVENAYWMVNPNVVIPAGSYTVLDSDPATWSQNSETGGAGMSWGQGIRMN